MDKLAKASNTIEIIKKYDFTFQKRYGQNFLTDPHVMEKIMDAAGLGDEDYVIEIGPGKTLSGFMKKINPELKSYRVSTTEDLDKLAEEINA